jgi:hypothetical protein
MQIEEGRPVFRGIGVTYKCEELRCGRKENQGFIIRGLTLIWGIIPLDLGEIIITLSVPKAIIDQPYL